MRLTDIRVRRYRSLEDVELVGLREFNVLVGRNNAGKSSILRAIQHVATVAGGQPSGTVDVFTDADPSKALSFELAFELSDGERQGYLQSLESRPPKRRDQLVASPFARKVRIVVGTEGRDANALGVSRLELAGEDGGWATIAERQADERMRMFQWEALGEIDRRHGALSPTALGPGGGGHNVFGGPTALAQWLRSPDPIAVGFAAFLRVSFFLSPFRHAEEELQVHESSQLTPTGSNLPQLLHAIHSNNPDRFRRIEAYVQAAIPDVGKLVTPLRQSATYVGFRQGSRIIRSKDMGTGVEELLMVAAILETVPNPNLFLEEPEGHLHPGAQRYLMDLVRERANLALITTHSPVLLSPSVDSQVYRVTLDKRRTSVRTAPDAAGMDEVLSEIGSRNSDLLLSDAVVFVEGPSDVAVLRALAGAIEAPFSLSRVTLLTLGGSEGIGPKAKVRSSVLEGISARTPIPHIFVLDQDERTARELRSLRELGERVAILGRRELENYLLVPHAVRTALIQRSANSPDLLTRAEAASDEEIASVIAEAIDALYGELLLKRVRAELGGLPGGLLPRTAVEELASLATKSSLGSAVKRHVRKRLDPLVSTARIAEVISQARATLDKDWNKPGKRAAIAPGADVLAGVFAKYGATYDKSKDGERIAAAMNASDVGQDLATIIRRASALPDAGST